VHPLLENRQRLAFYLMAWLPIAAILTIILKRDAAPWLETLLLAPPLAGLYAFMCMSAWYVCLIAPMRGPSLARSLGTLGAASALSSAVWILLGEIWAIALDPWMTTPGLGDHYSTQAATTFAIGMLLFLLAAAAHYILIAVDQHREAEKRTLEMQVLAREAELKALRAQIDPHFLFNSLNSISALTISDPQGARRMCLLLADFLRSSLVLGAKKEIPVSDELRLVESFLAIEKVRYGKRLSIDRSVDPNCNGCLVPPLLIQPLVENAIRHGIAPLVDGGTIRMDIQRDGAALQIILENPVEPGDGPITKDGAGVGLENVRSRLAKLFANEAFVGVSQENTRFQVRLRFPCIQFGETR
jgi:two-component system, LytTR family, sensor histidine kinase AlgZ